MKRIPDSDAAPGVNGRHDPCTGTGADGWEVDVAHCPPGGGIRVDHQRTATTARDRDSGQRPDTRTTSSRRRDIDDQIARLRELSQQSRLSPEVTHKAFVLLDDLFDGQVDGIGPRPYMAFVIRECDDIDVAVRVGDGAVLRQTVDHGAVHGHGVLARILEKRGWIGAPAVVAIHYRADSVWSRTVASLILAAVYATCPVEAMLIRRKVGPTADEVLRTLSYHVRIDLASQIQEPA